MMRMFFDDIGFVVDRFPGPFKPGYEMAKIGSESEVPDALKAHIACVEEDAIVLCTRELDWDLESEDGELFVVEHSLRIPWGSKVLYWEGSVLDHKNDEGVSFCESDSGWPDCRYSSLDNDERLLLAELYDKETSEEIVFHYQGRLYSRPKPAKLVRFIREEECSENEDEKESLVFNLEESLEVLKSIRDGEQIFLMDYDCSNIRPFHRVGWKKDWRDWYISDGAGHIIYDEDDEPVSAGEYLQNHNLLS